MPNNFDFSKLENVKIIEVNPSGWISPLYIEYGIAERFDILSYCWRVKGTLHTFVIPVARMDFLSSGDYKTLFNETLEGFREDYISWQEKKIEAPWVDEYRQQYKSFIVI
jgi:hypothetical protein